ncbi:MAG: hypothetical protein ACXVBB_10075, partial [Isosphaeraceae bacterium]
MIEVSPFPVRKMIIERGPSATFRASEGGVASVCQAKIDLVLLRVESNVLNPPGVLESQESGEESSVTHGRDLVEGDGYRTSAHTVVFCGGTEKTAMGETGRTGFQKQCTDDPYPAELAACSFVHMEAVGRQGPPLSTQGPRLAILKYQGSDPTQP